jgi:hypothetical protein
MCQHKKPSQNVTTPSPFTLALRNETLPLEMFTDSFLFLSESPVTIARAACVYLCRTHSAILRNSKIGIGKGLG